MIEWLMDQPNWLKPLPGLALLSVSAVIFLSGYIWFYGIAGGVVLLIAGFLMMGSNKGGYNF